MLGGVQALSSRGRELGGVFRTLAFLRHPVTGVAVLRRDRFTLVEVIVALIVAGILGALVIPLLGDGLIHSADAGTRVDESYDLMGVMEAIAEDYEASVVLGDEALAYLQDGVANGHYGQYGVLENKYIVLTSGSEAPGGDGTGVDDILKVIIQNSLGETLTGLFPNPDTSGN